MECSMRSLGAPEKIIARERARWEAAQPPHEPTEVFPENIPAFRVLLATADQWEYPTIVGGRLALSMTEINSCMEMFRIPRDVHHSLQVMTMIKAARAVKVKQYEASINSQRRKA